MCGIFGVIASEDSNLSPQLGKTIITNLLKLSESRGKEAAGLAFRTLDGVTIYKQAAPASVLVEGADFPQLLEQACGDGKHLKPIAIIGHARLVTNGTMEINFNNQPVIKDGLIGIHNGIIVNDEELWRKNSDLKRNYGVDTEILLTLINNYLKAEQSLPQALAASFQQIKGSASVAIFGNEWPGAVLATNTGSLYFCQNGQKNAIVFASEYYILKQLIKTSGLDGILSKDNIIQISGGDGYYIEFNTGTAKKIMQATQPLDVVSVSRLPKRLEIKDVSPRELKRTTQPLPYFNFKNFEAEVERAKKNIEGLERCRKCILPAAMPFIEFDDAGVCNYCRNYHAVNVLGEQELNRIADTIRSRTGRPDCLVTFSGGRDSSYALHYLVKNLDLKPLAYSYDWGMLTDLGRRNQARMCGSLGVEHILVSADIIKKRRYIRQNVEAWLKLPNLGTVPLFMAGDKQFFYYANQLQKQTNAPIIIFAENDLEKTYFKSGFCGVRPQFGSDNIHSLDLVSKFRLASYYGQQYVKNLAYLNSSIWDTLSAYFSYYLIPHDYLYFFNYVKWNEQEIESTLIQQYDWEIAADTKTTWRIGDGTAAFYNYIYYMVAGFTEFDTFRSNQIRESMIDRDKALALAARDNQPRWESLLWYADTIGIDLGAALQRINSMKKLF